MYWKELQPYGSGYSIMQRGGLHSPGLVGGAIPPSGIPSLHSVLLPAVPIAKKIIVEVVISRVQLQRIKMLQNEYLRIKQFFLSPFKNFWISALLHLDHPPVESV